MALTGIYGRVSTDEQTPETQLVASKQRCKQEGWKYRTFVDIAEKGNVVDQGDVLNRPEWRRLLTLVKKGVISRILVTKIDRITRDLHHACHFIEWYESVKKKYPDFEVVALMDYIDLDSWMGQMIFLQLALHATMEPKIISERTRAAMKRPDVVKKLVGGAPGRKWKKKK